MKFFSTFFFICFFQHFSFSQTSALENRINIKESDISIENILKKIEKSCQCNFSYKGDLFQAEEKKNINFNDKSLNEVLKTILGDEFDIILVDEKIILKIKERPQLIEILPKNIKIDTLPSIINIPKTEKILPLKKKVFKIISTHDSISFPIDSNLLVPSSSIQPKKNTTKIGCSISPLYKLSEYNRSNSGVSFSGFFDFKLIKRLNTSIGFSIFKTQLQNNKFNLDKLSNVELLNPSEDVSRNYQSRLSMIDIPILLRFNILKNHETYFLASGFSISYLSIRDNYFYNGEKVKYGHYYKLGVFDILTISGGFEKEFSKKNNLSLQIEPFVKFSLIEFSPENISLMYTGVSIRVNYFLGKNKF